VDSRVKPVGFGIASAENLSIAASFDGVVSPIVSPGVKLPVLTRNSYNTLRVKPTMTFGSRPPIDFDEIVRAWRALHGETL
jgi:hypothetical protein